MEIGRPTNYFTGTSAERILYKSFKIKENKKYDAWCFGGGFESANTLAKLVYDKFK